MLCCFAGLKRRIRLRHTSNNVTLLKKGRTPLPRVLVRLHLLPAMMTRNE